MTVQTCREVLARNSKSFALAARLLPRRVADDAAVVYAYCRRADDLIDESPSSAATVERLRVELDSIFSGAPQADAQLAAFQEVVARRRIPRAYLAELLDGMEMDVEGASYPALDALLLYCHRVAGTVGLMMCHVMGVRDPRALRHAAHLGIAMQLTNICRDVGEDWRMGRVYLPGALAPDASSGQGPFPRHLRDAAARATRILLEEADRYYASADGAIAWLGWRCAFAVRTARFVYAEIGRGVRRQGCDPLARRAVVPLWRKLALVARALFVGLRQVRFRLPGPSAPLTLVRFPDDVVPL
jgi:phytoene synthase